MRRPTAKDILVILDKLIFVINTNVFGSKYVLLKDKNVT